MESDMSFLYDYEKQGESVWCRGVYLIHSTFEPFWKDIYKWLPLKVQMLIGCLCLLIVTAEYNRSVISQLFQMYLLLQATRQNTCCQLVSFSSRVYYLDNQKKKKSVVQFFFNCTQSCFHHFRKLFREWHIESSCTKKWARRAHRSTHLDLYTLKMFPNNTKK